MKSYFLIEANVRGNGFIIFIVRHHISISLTESVLSFLAIGLPYSLYRIFRDDRSKRTEAYHF